MEKFDFSLVENNLGDAAHLQEIKLSIAAAGMRLATLDGDDRELAIIRKAAEMLHMCYAMFDNIKVINQ